MEECYTLSEIKAIILRNDIERTGKKSANNS